MKKLVYCQNNTSAKQAENERQKKKSKRKTRGHCSQTKVKKCFKK